VWAGGAADSHTDLTVFPVLQRRNRLYRAAAGQQEHHVLVPVPNSMGDTSPPVSFAPCFRERGNRTLTENVVSRTRSPSLPPETSLGSRATRRDTDSNAGLGVTSTAFLMRTTKRSSASCMRCRWHRSGSRSRSSGGKGGSES
jgi:hypothetical protein